MRGSPLQSVAGCFSACVTGYAHATLEERLPALPAMWHDASPACQPSTPRAASWLTCERVSHGTVTHVALGHGRSPFPSQPVAVLAGFTVQHKEVRPVQRSAVAAQLRDRTWQCEDSQALT